MTGRIDLLAMDVRWMKMVKERASLKVDLQIGKTAEGAIPSDDNFIYDIFNIG